MERQMNEQQYKDLRANLEHDYSRHLRRFYSQEYRPTVLGIAQSSVDAVREMESYQYKPRDSSATNESEKEKEMSFRKGDKVLILQPHKNAGCITTVVKDEVDWVWVEGGLKEPLFNGPTRKEVKLLERTMDNLEKGDVLVNKDKESWGFDRLVVQVFEYNDTNYVVAADTDDQNVGVYEVGDLEDDGWAVRGETVELTVAEIAEKLGHPVKVIEG